MATPKVSEAAVAGIEVGQPGLAPRGLWTRFYQPALLATATGCDGEAQKEQQPSGNGAAVVATVTSL